LLVLIIIFMVITPLTPKGLDALVPQPNPNQQQPNEDILNRTIVVSIDAEKSIKINQDAVDIRMLGSRLEDIFKTRNERVIFVKGDATLQFGEIAQIIDIAKGAGIDKIGLMTAKIEAGQ
jgi:biopolymer transport protein ExbD